jgi:hypothetical protein
MRGESTKEPEALVARYGVGLRLATRIVALLSRRTEVTGTVLAAAGADGALERLLLEQDLLDNPQAVREDALRKRAGELGCRDAGLLRVVEGHEPGWRAIVLEDDLLAEQVRGDGQAEPLTDEMSLVRAAPRGMSTRETAELFTPEEVARLKLAALTSQNSDERIESMRRLVYAPVEGAQKAGVFLSVLVDAEAELRVRREAIRSLEQIGFRSDIAEALRGLFEEEPKMAVYGIQRLRALLKEAEQGEAALSLAVILEVLDQAKDGQIIAELLELVAASAPSLVGSRQKAEQFVRSALRQLARDFGGLRAGVEAALNACASHAPELTVDLLWQELQRNEDPSVRSLVLNLCESLVKDDRYAPELASHAVGELLNPALPESEKARLRYGLLRLGEPAVNVALDRIGVADPLARSELVRLLDVLCTEGRVSDELIQRSVLALLDLLKLADTATRRIVLQATVLGDRRVRPSLQAEIARELLALMGELNLPDTQGAIRNTLERIGPPALVPAFEFMRRAYPSQAARCAARALGSIVRDHGDQVEDDLADRTLRLCNSLLEDERLERGEFVIALASVCGYSRQGARHFDATLKALKQVMWKRPYAMDIFEALGLMAGSSNAKRSHQKELFELFDGVVQLRPTAALGRPKETGEGMVYEFGREIEFDTRVLPAAVKGLERICASRQASQQMRMDVVKRLLILWEGVSKVRIVWGPSAIDALVSAMSSAACAEGATVGMKVRLGTSLLRFLNKVSVIRSIGQVCSQPDRSAQMRELAVTAGAQMLDEWELCELQDRDRRLALLRSAGRIASSPALDSRSEAVLKVRERALEALFSGLREGMSEVREPLLLMRDCPDLSDAQKAEIDGRMSKAFGLVRLGSPRSDPRAGN